MKYKFIFKMSMHSFDGNNLELAGYPIIGTPITGDLLIFQNGSWQYVTISGTGAIVGISNEGTGVGIYNTTISEVAFLRSLSSTTNLTITLSGQNIVFDIAPVQSNIQSITSSSGILSLLPSTIKIPNIPSITPASFLGINSSGNLGIFTYYPQLTGVSNEGTGTGLIYDTTTSNIAYFRSLTGNTDITITTTGPNITIALNSVLNGVSTINNLSFIDGSVLEINTPIIKIPNISSGTPQTILGISNGSGNPIISFTPNYQTVGTGESLINGSSVYSLTLKSITSNNSITVSDTGSTITFGLNPVISNVTSLSSTSNALIINQSNITFPNVTSGTATSWLGLTSGNQLCETTGGGTVTSVGLSLPNIFIVTNSPVDNVGTLTATLNSQAANEIFAGPTSGPNNTPTFRSMVAADLPNVGSNAVVYGNSSGVISSDSTNFTWNDTNKLLNVTNSATVIPSTGGVSANFNGPVTILNGVNDSYRFISALDNSMTTGTKRYIAFGQAASSNNQAELYFQYNSSGSLSNFLSLGTYGNSVLQLSYSKVSILAPLNMNNETLIDSTSSAGTSGQILSSTGTGVQWITSSVTNIYDSDGTLTQNTRTVNPYDTSINNVIVFNNVRHKFVNSITYNPTYLNPSANAVDVNFMRFYDSSGQSWGKYECTNCETQTTNIPALGVSGNYTYFYTSLANGSPTVLPSWYLRVYLYENNSTIITPWFAEYDICITAVNNTYNYQCVYPKNYVYYNTQYLLEVVQNTPGNQYTLALRLRNVSSTSATNVVNAKIESYGEFGKAVSLTQSSGNIALGTVGPSLNPTLGGTFTNGICSSNAIPSVLWNYTTYPKMIRITYDFQYNIGTFITSNSVITVSMNGHTLFTRLVGYNNSIYNSQGSVSGSYIMDTFSSMASGALVIGSNTISASATSNAGNLTFTGQAYLYNIEFY